LKSGRHARTDAPREGKKGAFLFECASCAVLCEAQCCCSTAAIPLSSSSRMATSPSQPLSNTLHKLPPIFRRRSRPARFPCECRRRRRRRSPSPLSASVEGWPNNHPLYIPFGRVQAFKSWPAGLAQPSYQFRTLGRQSRRRLGTLPASVPLRDTIRLCCRPSAGDQIS